jgi:hypothetical protein
MSNDDKKLMQLKAEQRARSARDEQLRKLIDQSSTSIEDRIAAVKTVMQTDQVRFSSSVKKMMEK